jgi:hypothetical protein
VDAEYWEEASKELSKTEDAMKKMSNINWQYSVK